MPDFSEADVQKILKLRREGKLEGEIAREMSAPPAGQPGGMTPEQQAALARDQAALAGGETTPPGHEPEQPLGEAMMNAAGFRPDRARDRQATRKEANAAIGLLFGRAAADDDSAVFKRPNESWAAATDRWRRSQP